jgi:hypothetical protein
VSSEPEAPNGAGSRSEQLAPEAGAFWDGADTQEFVGVAPGASQTARCRLAVSRGRITIVAALLGAGIVSAAVVLQQQPIPKAASSATERRTPANSYPDLVTREATRHRAATGRKRARPARHRSTAPRRHESAHAKIIAARYAPQAPTPPSAPQYADQPQSKVPSSAAPATAVAASGDHRSSSTAASQPAGPTGPGALTGAGSTPSG